MCEDVNKLFILGWKQLSATGGRDAARSAENAHQYTHNKAKWAPSKCASFVEQNKTTCHGDIYYFKFLLKLEYYEAG